MDTVNIHVHAMLAGGDRDRPAFVAIRLDDGRSPDNGQLYESREEASRFFQHDLNVFWLKVGADTLAPRQALLFLQMYRMARKSGHMIGRTEVVVPQLTELMGGMLPRTLKGLNG